MLKLYDSPISPCCMKVRLCLAEKALWYEKLLLDVPAKENLQPGYLAINPKGVVPTLLDGDTVVVESTLINEYLDDKWPEPPLKPPAPAARVAMRLWTKLVDEELHPANGAVFWGLLALAPLKAKDPEEAKALIRSHPDPRRVARQLAIFDQGFAAPVVGEGLRVFVRVLDKMETALADSPWLAGDTMSLADLALLPYANEVLTYGLEAMAADKPHLHAWFERMRERPAYAVAVRDVVPASRWADIADRGRAAWDELRRHLD